MDTFDEDDLAALRALVRRDETATRTKRVAVRRGASAPLVQLNVRVRLETSERVRELAERSNTTIADIVGRAIDELFSRGATSE